MPAHRNLNTALPHTPLSDAELLAQFEGWTLPAERWHHAEHIRIAYLCLRHDHFPLALERMRAGLKALNAAQRVPESLDRGYHETLTQAWFRLVHVILTDPLPHGKKTPKDSEPAGMEDSHFSVRGAV